MTLKEYVAAFGIPMLEEMPQLDEAVGCQQSTTLMLLETLKRATNWICTTMHHWWLEYA